jgi:hypothetical protein
MEPQHSAVAADHEEVPGFLDRNRLFGAGITWIDAHLLGSARLSHCRMWTLDATSSQPTPDSILFSPVPQSPSVQLTA